jgi:hypothetical protein
MDRLGGAVLSGESRGMCSLARVSDALGIKHLSASLDSLSHPHV